VFVHDNFAHLQSILERHAPRNPTHIYYDLGLNSAHVDDDSRGFSFSKDAPLDMRFDRTSDEMSAFDVVNSYSSEDLKKIFWEYGDEKKTPFIVEAIIKARNEKPIETTLELAEIIHASSFDPKSTVRVFQAIRMEVNQELQVISDSLATAANLLQVGGRISVITFHSVEDRLVKQIFNELTTAPKDSFT